jgi:hypothetical protein
MMPRPTPTKLVGRPEVERDSGSGGQSVTSRATVKSNVIFLIPFRTLFEASSHIIV